MTDKKSYNDYVETITNLNNGTSCGEKDCWRIREETTLPVEELRSRIHNSTVKAKIDACSVRNTDSRDFPVLTETEYEYLMGYSDTKPEPEEV